MSEKLYKVTRESNAAIIISSVESATSLNNAKWEARQKDSRSMNEKFFNYKANVVLHNVDGKEKSLSKIKKLP